MAFCAVTAMKAQCDSARIFKLYSQAWSELYFNETVDQHTLDSLKIEVFDDCVYDVLINDINAQKHILNGHSNLAKRELEKIKLKNVRRGIGHAIPSYHNSLGTLYQLEGEKDSALYHWDLALKGFSELEYLRHVVGLKLKIGTTLYQRRIENDSENKRSLEDVAELKKMGIVFLDLASFNQAEYFFKIALDDALRLNNHDQAAELLVLLGDVLFYQGKNNKSREHYTSAIEFNNRCGLCFYSIGRSYLKEENLSQASKYLELAIPLLIEEGDDYHLSDAFSYQAGLYHKLDSLDKAFLALGNLESLYAKLEAEALDLDLERRLIESSFIVQPNQADQFFTSLREQETINKLYQEESLYQIDKKEAQIHELEKDELKARNRAQAYVFSGLIVLLIAALLFIRNRVLSKNKIIAELETKQKESQLQHSRIRFSKKSDDFDKLLEKLKLIDRNKSDGNIQTLLSEIKATQIVERSWADYTTSFEESNPNLFAHLKHQGISLTRKEMRLCGLIAKGYKIGDIANITNVQPNTVEVSRYRLRKKLRIEKNVSLQDYLSSFA